MPHCSKDKGIPSKQKLQAKYKGKWGQMLLTAVVAVRPGEVIISAVCGYCISLGLLSSKLYSTVLCSEDLL